jgi:hypothetical protein
MLARVQSLFVRGYHPLPTRPVEAASRPAPLTRSNAGREPDVADVLARWGEIIEHRFDVDPVLNRIDVAECLGKVLHAIDMPARERPERAIGCLLGSVHLLQAVIAAGSSVAVEYRGLAEDIQTAYLVALGMAATHDCLSAEDVLGLLVGQAGRANANSPVESRAYAHHILSLGLVSERHAFTFGKIVDLAIRSSERDGDEGVVRMSTRRDLLIQKGYGRTGRSNFYSALALGESSIGHVRVLRVLMEFDLLPSAAELAFKGGRRGHELELALTAVVPPSCEEFRGVPQEEMECLRSSFDASLSAANLQTLREQHRGRMAVAAATARQLDDALVAVGLR